LYVMSYDTRATAIDIMNSKMRGVGDKRKSLHKQ
jgi:hypothetical protein